MLRPKRSDVRGEMLERHASKTFSQQASNVLDSTRLIETLLQQYKQIAGRNYRVEV